MQMDEQDIAARLKAGYMVSEQEKAYLLSRNPYALAAFMIENNPGSVNYRLRNTWGYNHLTFEPDAKKLARQMEIIIQRRDREVFEDVVRNFNLVPDGLSPEFIQEFVKAFNS